MVKQVKIKKENITVDDNYYVIYKMLEEILNQLRKMRWQ